MSNAKHASPAARPLHPWGPGDHGLGFCYSCIVDYAAARGAGTGPPPVLHAITLAPAALPMPAGVGMVALPSCYEHLVPNRGGNGASRLLRV